MPASVPPAFLDILEVLGMNMQSRCCCNMEQPYRLELCLVYGLHYLRLFQQMYFSHLHLLWWLCVSRHGSPFSPAVLQHILATCSG